MQKQIVFSKKGTDKFEEWDIKHKYQIDSIVGKGSYGQVCKATCLKSGVRVAIKKIDKVFDDTIDCKRILREITLLRKLKHPCVVNLIEVLQPSKNLDNYQTIYLVFEFAESDIKKILKSPMHLEMVHIKTIIYNLLCAMKFLNESKVLHRDLKPANILVNEDCTIKLCDFGLARSMTNISTNSKTILDSSKLPYSVEPKTEESKKRDLSQRLTKTQDLR